MQPLSLLNHEPSPQLSPAHFLSCLAFDQGPLNCPLTDLCPLTNLTSPRALPYTPSLQDSLPAGDQGSVEQFERNSAKMPAVLDLPALKPTPCLLTHREASHPLGGCWQGKALRVGETEEPEPIPSPSSPFQAHPELQGYWVAAPAFFLCRSPVRS